MNYWENWTWLAGVVGLAILMVLDVTGEHSRARRWGRLTGWTLTALALVPAGRQIVFEKTNQGPSAYVMICVLIAWVIISVASLRMVWKVNHPEKDEEVDPSVQNEGPCEDGV